MSRAMTRSRHHIYRTITGAAMTLCMVLTLPGLTSCHPLKKLTPPATEMPADFGIVNGDTVAGPIAEKWGVMFADSTLRGMIDKALEHNKDILKAAAHLEEVRQLYGIAKADYFPSIDGTIRGERETKKYHDNNNPKGNFTPDPQLGIKVHIGWELNLMGKLEYARRQAEADYKATAEDLRAIKLIVTEQVASAYYRLLAQETILAITRYSLDSRRESMEKAKLRFEAGLTSELVFLQTRTEYLSTQSLIPDLELQADKYRTMLHILIGEYPTENDINRNAIIVASPPEELPTGVPSELLKRRPDLMASSHRLEAAAQAVGVAYADRFPSLKLDFTIGFWNSQFPGLFKSLYYDPAGAIAGSIFDFGRKKRMHQAAVERYEQARLQYEQDILTAFGEVKDSSLGYIRAHETANYKREFLSTAQNYLKLARLQYHAGTLNYIDVLDAQRRLFDAQIGLCNAIRDEYLARVQLYKAIGN